MTSVTKRARESPRGATPVAHFYDYTYMRPGRQVKYYEPLIAAGALPHADTATVDYAVVAFVEGKRTSGPVGALAERITNVSSGSSERQVDRVDQVAPMLERVVDELLNIWMGVSAHQSSIRRTSQHPSFELLRKTSKLAIERIVPRLRRDPNPLWIWALGELSGEDPAKGVDTPREAARAWVEWADERGLD